MILRHFGSQQLIRLEMTVEAIRILLAILLGEVVLLLIWSQRQRKFPDLRFYLRLH